MGALRQRRHGHLQAVLATVSHRSPFDNSYFSTQLTIRSPDQWVDELQYVTAALCCSLLYAEYECKNLADCPGVKHVGHHREVRELNQSECEVWHAQVV
jgi:hypothetical protein